MNMNHGPSIPAKQCRFAEVTMGYCHIIIALVGSFEYLQSHISTSVEDTLSVDTQKLSLRGFAVDFR